MKRYLIWAIVITVLTATVVVPAQASLDHKEMNDNTNDISFSTHDPDDGNNLKSSARECGGEWVNNYPSEDDLSQSSHSVDEFLDKIKNDGDGFSEDFEYGDSLAWKQDFMSSSEGGTEDDYVDDVDIAMYQGHGNTDGLTFRNDVPAGDDDEKLLRKNDAKDDVPYPHEGAYGDEDLEWMGWRACYCLSDNDWYESFDGLHLLLGLDGWAKDINSGQKWANKMIDDGWWDTAHPVKASWFASIDNVEPWVETKVIGENGAVGDDYLWGEGSVASDPSHDGSYKTWEDNTFKSTRVFSSNIDGQKTMPIYKTVPNDDQNKIQYELKKKLGIRNRVKRHNKYNGVVYETAEDGTHLMVHDNLISYTTESFTESTRGLKNDASLSKEKAKKISDGHLRCTNLLHSDYTKGSFTHTRTGNFIKEQHDTKRGLVNKQVIARTNMYRRYLNGYPVYDSFIKTHINNEGDLTSLSYKSKDVEKSGQTRIMSQKEVKEYFNEYGWDTTVKSIQAQAQLGEINRMSLGYRGGSFDKETDFLMPVYIINADITVKGEKNVKDNVNLCVPAVEKQLTELIKKNRIEENTKDVSSIRYSDKVKDKKAQIELSTINNMKSKEPVDDESQIRFKAGTTSKPVSSVNSFPEICVLPIAKTNRLDMEIKTAGILGGFKATERPVMT